MRASTGLPATINGHPSCISDANVRMSKQLEILRMLEHNNILRSTKVSITVLAIVAFALLLSYTLWFFVYLGEPLSSSPSVWGAFGDYIGGVLNPLVASFALYWLVTSVRLQKQELHETRVELTKAGKAQEKQARMQLFSSQISGWSVRLENVLRDIQSLRDDLNFVRNSARDKEWCDIRGNRISYTEAMDLIESLEDRERLLNEMRETIDSEIKRLLTEVESSDL